MHKGEMHSTVEEMHSKEIAQSMVKRNAIYMVIARSDLIETVEGWIQTAFACTDLFFFREI